MKIHKTYIPENLKLDELANIAPSSVTKDHIAYIIGNILVRASYRKDEALESDGFIPMSSIILKKYLPNYKDVLEFLVEQKVLERTEYIPDVKCRNYRLRINARTSIISHTITDNKLIRRIKKREGQLKQENKAPLTPCPNLDRWFDDGFEFDFERAEMLLENLRKKEHNISSCDVTILVHEGCEKDPCQLSSRINHLQYPKESEIGDENCSAMIKVADPLIGKTSGRLSPYTAASLTVERIRNKDYRLGRDRGGQRYYSPLTNLKKVFRSCVSYRGEKLVQIDIKNSQPYMLIYLLKEMAIKSGVSFEHNGQLRSALYSSVQYEDSGAVNGAFNPNATESEESNTGSCAVKGETRGQLKPVLISSAKYEDNGAFSLNEEKSYVKCDDLDEVTDAVSNEKIRLDKGEGGYGDIEGDKGRIGRKGGRVSIGGIMFPKTPLSIDYQSFRVYISDVLSGTIYEKFMARAKSEYSITLTRDRAKIEVLKAMYSDPNWRGRRPAKPVWDATLKEVFIKMYPGVFEVIRCFDKEYPGQLPIYLQRIESFLVIDRVVKRISRERRHIPQYTIHDSISTTEEHLKYIHQVMHEEFKKVIEVKPPLSTKPW